MNKIKAINGNVLILRHTQDSEHLGLHISEGAQVKSCYGDIAFIDDSCEFAKVGDTVNIPSRGVEDIVYDGVEYALCKVSRLFLVNDEPVNKYVRVLKCENQDLLDDNEEVFLYLTDKQRENTNWVEVIDVANDCERIRKEWVGLFCHSPETSERLERIGYSDEWTLGEELIEFLTEA